LVSIFITDTFIGEEVNPEMKHHQAYTLMGEKKHGVVYERKYRKVEDRVQPIMTQLLEEFHIVHNITSNPLEYIQVLLTHTPNFIQVPSIGKNDTTNYSSDTTSPPSTPQTPNMSGTAATPAVHVAVTRMPAHGHSTVPHFNGNALNLHLYFDEVESLFIDASLNEEGKV
jgi:hypothetical protein